MARNEFIDDVRGFAMLYIVCWIHGLYWLDVGSNPVRSVFLFEMPLVFLVFGAALGMQMRGPSFNDKAGAMRYLGQRLIRLYVPYALYGVGCALFVWAHNSAPDFNLLGLILTEWLNPLTYGGNWSHYFLNWHLWFMPVLLLVNLAMLPVIFIHLRSDYLIFIFLAFALLVFGWLYFHKSQLPDLLITTMFYLIFAVIGFYGSRTMVSQTTLLYIFLGSLLIFLGLLFIEPSIDMQKHKFPPDFVFLLFSLVMSAGLAWLFHRYTAPRRLLHTLMQLPVFRLFKSAGYSIYLWQGFGYSSAMVIAKKEVLPLPSQWLLSIALTIFSGYLFSFAEKIRLRTRPNA